MIVTQQCEYGLPQWLSSKNVCLQCRRCKFYPWVRKIPWRRKWQPIPVLLPGESHGQRSLAGCYPWGRRESGMTRHTAHWPQAGGGHPGSSHSFTFRRGSGHPDKLGNSYGARQRQGGQSPRTRKEGQGPRETRKESVYLTLKLTGGSLVPT